MQNEGSERAALAQLLREHRKARRLTGPELAEALGVTQGTISKLEHGRLAPSIDFLSKFSHHLRLNRSETEELIRRAGVVPQHSDAADFLKFLPYDFLNADWTNRRQQTFGQTEARAKAIRVYQPLMVPGLLQTEAYARRVFGLAGVTNPRQLERSVRSRLGRHKVLADGTKQFSFLLTEAALRAPIGTLQERRTQVLHLLELARRPNLHIGIIPAGRPLSVVPPPAFHVFDADRVFVELPHGDLWLLEPSHAASAYLDTFRKIQDSADLAGDMVAALEQLRRRLAA